MKLSLFKKSKKTEKSEAAPKPDAGVVQGGKDRMEQESAAASKEIDVADSHRVLKQFYISEKGTAAGLLNKYLFLVDRYATKNEIKKHVSRIFRVTVKSVHVLNMPAKRRDLGKHPGERPGFKKAIVTLKEGDVIEQAKP